MNKDQLIAEAKKKYGKVFSTEDIGIEFIFRPMTKAEVKYFSDLARSESTTDVEEMVVDRCVIWPETYDLDKHAAGFISTFCSEIRDFSGFEDQEGFVDLIDQSRASADKLTNLIKAFIIAAMPTFHPDEIDNLTLFKSIELLGLAEKILELKSSEAPTLAMQDPDDKVDPIEAKLRMGMMKAMQDTGMNLQNVESPR